MLHLVSDTSVNQALVTRIADGDVVLLLNAAVLLALSNCEADLVVQGLLLKARCCVLDEHVQQYGIPSSRLVPGVEVVSYLDFVQLTVEQASVQSWC